MGAALVAAVLTVLDRAQPGPIIVLNIRAIYLVAFGAYALFAFVLMTVFGSRSPAGAVLANAFSIAIAATLVVLAR